METEGKRLALNSNLINEIFYNVGENTKFY